MRAEELPNAGTTGQPLREGDALEDLIKQLRQLLQQSDQIRALELFNQLHPADQADLLGELSLRPRQELVGALNSANAAEIIKHLEPGKAVEVLGELDSPDLAEILDATSPDVAADILRSLPAEKSREALAGMEDAEEVLPLLGYAEDTAGGLMITGYPVIRDTVTAGNALDQLRLLGQDADDVGRVIIADDSQQLVGTLSVTRLALARPALAVGVIADRNILSVSTDTDQEECVRLVQRYDLDQLPVVDRDGKLAGVILAEDIVDVMEEEATEDMYRMAAVAGERVFGPLIGSLRNRLPWLYVNLATAFLAAAVVSLFESSITKVVALAVFLPVVASQGGIGGTQTVTLVVRSMALGELPGRLGLSLLSREMILGMVNGALLGVVVGVVVYLWKGNPFLGLVLGLALLGNMVIAGLTGAGVPLLLRRFRLDPAVSSAVFVTTFTDVFGFLLFLGMAAALISVLL